MPQQRVEFKGDIYEFPDDATPEEISAQLDKMDPEVYNATVNEPEVNRQRLRKELMTSQAFGSPVGVPLGLPIGPQMGGPSSPIVKGLRGLASRMWSGAAKSTDDVAEQVLSRGAGRLTPRNTQALMKEAKAGSRDASTILDPVTGQPAIEAVKSPLWRPAFAHRDAVRAGGRSLDTADVAGVAAAPYTGGASALVPIARMLARPGLRATAAQGIYSGAQPTARAAALATLLGADAATGMEPVPAHGGRR